MKLTLPPKRSCAGALLGPGQRAPCQPPTLAFLAPPRSPSAAAAAEKPTFHDSPSFLFPGFASTCTLCFDAYPTFLSPCILPIPYSAPACMCLLRLHFSAPNCQEHPSAASSPSLPPPPAILPNPSSLCMCPLFFPHSRHATAAGLGAQGWQAPNSQTTDAPTPLPAFFRHDNPNLCPQMVPTVTK